MLTSLLVAAIVAAQTQAPAAPPVARTVAIIGRTLDADGRSPSYIVVNQKGDFTTFIFTEAPSPQGLPCGFWPMRASGQDYVPTNAAFGWRVEGHVTTDTPTQISVRIAWQRMWESGRSVNGPSAVVDLTLRPEDRTSLDVINVPAAAASPCNAGGITLQAAFLPNTARGGGGIAGGIANMPASGARATGGGGGGRGGGMSAGAGGVNGGGGATSAIADALRARAAELRATVSAGGAGSFGGVLNPCLADPSINGGRVPIAGGIAMVTENGGCAAARSNFDPQTLETIEVELWLVHTSANGRQDTQYRKVATTPNDGKFSFDSVAIGDGAARVVVDVIGQVQAQQLPNGMENLDVLVVRKIAVPGAGRDWLGTAGKTLSLTAMKTGDVVAIEIPSAPIGDTFPEMAGHTFSVRVRVNR